MRAESHAIGFCAPRTWTSLSILRPDPNGKELGLGLSLRLNMEVEHAILVLTIPLPISVGQSDPTSAKTTQPGRWTQLATLRVMDAGTTETHRVRMILM